MCEGIELANEFKGIDFKSARLEKRFIKTMDKLSKQPDKSVWLASGTRAEAKAVYRLLGNEKVEKNEVLRAHRESTKQRMQGHSIILAIQDTTTLNYNNHTKTEGLGYVSDKILGINIHSCLAVTSEGVTLGVLEQTSYTRPARKDDTANHDKKKQRPIEEKESNRWLETMTNSTADMPPEIKFIHVCDREGDMYELFEKAAATGNTFLIRVIQNRSVAGGQRIIDEIKKTPPSGEVSVIIPRDSRKNIKERKASLRVSYKNFDVQKPKLKNVNKTLSPSVNMTVIYVREAQEDENTEPIEWILATNDEIDGFDDAYDKVCNYIQRWKIERFHYVLKSGCQIEKLQERSVGKTVLLILMYSVIAVMILNMTYLARLFPDAGCDLIFEEDEWKVLYCAANKTKTPPSRPYSMREAIEYVARLGGFKGAKSDGSPGVKVVWIGLNKLHILLAYREYMT